MVSRAARAVLLGVVVEESVWNWKTERGSGLRGCGLQATIEFVGKKHGPVLARESIPHSGPAATILPLNPA